ncbi:MAG: DNA-directed RNA polymerase subunit beta [Firmicutes bacterium]|nr:DNA-directed RNA polymerase subunit beta [Bacillota bacterium]
MKKTVFGNRERYSFSKIKDVLAMPYLIEVQKNSFEAFVRDGIREVFEDFSPIVDNSGKIELNFLSHTLDGIPKYTEKECKERDTTYACPLKVMVRLLNTETGEIVEQEVFMGDFPLMTPNGSFIINGAERVIVSQLVRSPGVYCACEKDVKTGANLFRTTVMPSRGAWLEFEMDHAGVLYVKVDRTRKVTATILLRSLGIGSDDELNALFHNEPIIAETCSKDTAKTAEEALLELSKRLRPGEIPSLDSIRTHLYNLLFDRKRYDLTRVGRYKFNKKLCIATRITGLVSAADVKADGILLAAAGEVISKEAAERIHAAGINEVKVGTESGKTHFVTGNNFVFIQGAFGFHPSEFEQPRDYIHLPDSVHLPTLREVLGADLPELKKMSKEALYAAMRENMDKIWLKHVLVDDIVAAVNYIIGLHYGLGSVDNIDHLGNRRVRSVGELLQNQFRIGISRLERVIRERMQIQDTKDLTPQSLINIRPVSSAIREFFGSSQLSQFMDQSNPIAELTHKRKLSALGPGGLNRERASFDVRDVHYSHYGRMCPIETPEGQNIGLITSLPTFARVNEYGFIESPYRKVDKTASKVTEEVHYLTADDEDEFVIAQANEPLDEKDWFINKRVMMRHREDIAEIERESVDYMDVSPKQLVSVATSLIPFLENDDTNRALMGSNMQRQAVPLLRPEAPIIGTGMEHKVAYDSGVMTLARRDGVVEYVSSEQITVKAAGGEHDTYLLQKFQRSNQGTCINQRALVRKGDAVVRGSVLADGPSTDNTELALGRNVLIAFMSWEGYNYEDAIMISERLVKQDVFTSIHIEEHELEARDTKLGAEEITCDIPNVAKEQLANLDALGIVRVGAVVRAGDILVGKVTPKGETDLTPEERLLRAIFGEKAREVRDTSLRVPHGEGGIVVDVKIFTRANKDELSPGVNKLVRVYIAQKRKVSVGDKMAGRHGNKGVISRIVPEEDMPFLADGTPIDIVLNPLGVPSRMNIGQVLEVHLGLVAKMLGIYVATPVFDGASEQDIKKLLLENRIVNEQGKVDGKIELYDGRTGMPFESRVTVGYMYMLKLVHLVDDKIHARSTGPYSLVTQQPLGGKAQFGGQRFGEMEVWALYAYGAANMLQEIMTIKSDDITGRVKAYESIIKGLNIPEPGVPESFKVLIKELQSLALDVKVLAEDKQEIGIREIIEDERELMDIGLSGERDYERIRDEEGSLSLDDLPDDDDETDGEEVKNGFGLLMDDDEDDFGVDKFSGLSEDELDDLDDLGIDGEDE